MRLKIWLALWWLVRKRAVLRLREDFPDEYRQAMQAWVRDKPSGALDSPAWNTRGLDHDLALHDAADYLLGKNA